MTYKTKVLNPRTGTTAQASLPMSLQEFRMKLFGSTERERLTQAVAQFKDLIDGLPDDEESADDDSVGEILKRLEEIASALSTLLERTEAQQ